MRIEKVLPLPGGRMFYWSKPDRCRQLMNGATLRHRIEYLLTFQELLLQSILLEIMDDELVL